MQPSIRLLSGALGTLVLVATCILPFVMPNQNASDGSLIANISELSRYFTIWVNITLGILLVLSSLRGYWKSFQFVTACVVWMLIVGGIYHSVIAPVHNPIGWDALVNFVHHTIAPITFLLIWLLTSPRKKISKHQPIYWLSYPAIYSAYAILRGTMYDGYFPYPFLNPDFLGWSFLLLFMLGSTILLIVLGYVSLWCNQCLISKSEGQKIGR